MTTITSTPTTDRPVTGRFLDALTARDFTELSRCLTPDVRMRGLIPPGPFDTDTADAAVSRFRHWFGGPDAFEVLSCETGRVGDKVYLRYLVRMWPIDTDAPARIAEQHLFAVAGDRIEAIDLLCSGWNPERPYSRT
ncbi:nuclear transport factor 2 family protein [Nocardia mikamii]|uniref:nuclear transport factor 2 family protein n=1 Tax=Nocardia mikamii TaxID=508464 RepID=UPI0007A3EBFD|nr:nuclear transport factor 2 family protein [Nocardia mikamii]